LTRAQRTAIDKRRHVSRRFIRMIKLIRALKFMAKLNKLKQKEGFEVSLRALSLYIPLPASRPLFACALCEGL
jgi:hypothetical protein